MGSGRLTFLGSRVSAKRPASSSPFPETLSDIECASHECSPRNEHGSALARPSYRVLRLRPLLPGQPAGPASCSAGHSSAQSASPLDAAITTRLVPLYYNRDAEKVIATVRGPMDSPARPPEFPGNERHQTLEEERRLLQSQRAALLAKRSSQPTPPAQFTSSTGGLLKASGLVPTPAPSIDQELAAIERNLRLLDDQDQVWRAETFRDQSQAATSGSPVVSKASDSPNAVDRVRITVVGEGQLHLCGPREGVNAITRMIHEIDQPVGEIKIGIHVAQFSGTEDGKFGSVPAVLEKYLEHARQLSLTSQLLFRAALGNVAARYYSTDPSRFEEAFFYGPCIQNFHRLNGSAAALVARSARFAGYRHDIVPRGCGQPASAAGNPVGVPAPGGGRITETARGTPASAGRFAGTAGGHPYDPRATGETDRPEG